MSSTETRGGNYQDLYLENDDILQAIDQIKVKRHRCKSGTTQNKTLQKAKIRLYYDVRVKRVQILNGNKYIPFHLHKYFCILRKIRSHFTLPNPH